MRWFMTLALMALAAPAFAQENEAEKLYRAFEKKLLAAKAYRFSFDLDANGPNKFKFRGELLVAAGNKLKVSFVGTDNDQLNKPISGSAASDGKQYRTEFIKDGQPQSKSNAAPEQLTEYLTSYLAMLDSVTAIGYAGRSRPEQAPGKVKPGGFKLGAKERFGDREIQAVEYTVVVPDRNGDQQYTVQLWLDPKSQVPLKRVAEYQGAIVVTEHYSNWQWEPKLAADEFTLPK
jgi:outer membrane lipoprotein-sorting protein